MRKPDFFIVGAPKCGTLSMSQYLGQHPEVFMTHVKEPYFFGPDLGRDSPYRDRDLYLSLFSAARDEKRVGEASVRYLYSERAAEEIKEFDPRARIIVMLRDPVEMLYSMHGHLLFHGTEDIADFGAALEAEEDRKRGLRVPEGVSFIRRLFYRESARISPNLERYFRVFGRENVHIVVFDDFRADTTGEYERTLRFLGVDPDFRPEFHIANLNRQARSKALRMLLRDPPRPVRRLARALPTPARRRLGEGLERYNTRRGRRAPMDAELSERLRAEFAPEVERLGDLLGRDLSHWSRA